MSNWLWLNGRLCNEDEAGIPPSDSGFLVGYGVFEALVARGGRAIAGPEHWERLAKDCEVMGMPVLPRSDFDAAIADVIRANGITDARIRVTQTPETTLVTAGPLKAWPPTEKVVVCPWTRNDTGALAGVKSTSYAENRKAMAYANARDCGEALLSNTRGELCEGSASNVFLVRQGRLSTPPLMSGCLPGVTRALVLKACAEGGVPCIEEPLPMAAIQECVEAFLTSSTRGVHPIAELEGRGLPAPGPVTEQVRQLYAKFVRQY
jgi:branched-chain amino acid aminotransferase